MGAVLTLQLGLGFGMVDFGQFTVNSVSASGPPDILRIEEHAVPMAGKGKMQERKSRSWDGMTLADIVKVIARENSLHAVVANDLASLDPGNLDQTDESDVSFLARIAREFSAALKITSGKLAFIGRGTSLMASCAVLPTVPLQHSDLSRWSVAFADSGNYKSVVASYRDLHAAAATEVLVGEGEPVFYLPHTYSNETNGRRAAKTRLDDFARHAGSKIQLEMPPGWKSLPRRGGYFRCEAGSRWHRRRPSGRTHARPLRPALAARLRRIRRRNPDETRVLFLEGFARLFNHALKIQFERFTPPDQDNEAGLGKAALSAGQVGVMNLHLYSEFPQGEAPLNSGLP